LISDGAGSVVLCCLPSGGNRNHCGHAFAFPPRSGLFPSPSHCWRGHQARLCEMYGWGGCAARATTRPPGVQRSSLRRRPRLPRPAPPFSGDCWWGIMGIRGERQGEENSDKATAPEKTLARGGHGVRGSRYPTLPGDLAQPGPRGRGMPTFVTSCDPRGPARGPRAELGLSVWVDCILCPARARCEAKRKYSPAEKRPHVPPPSSPQVCRWAGHVCFWCGSLCLLGLRCRAGSKDCPAPVRRAAGARRPARSSPAPPGEH